MTLGNVQSQLLMAHGRRVAITARMPHYHSKNATFSIRNYFTGALLYQKHLCQKGRDSKIRDNLYLGTSKSAEDFCARKTFNKAKEEGLDVEIHWQDANSSSSIGVQEAFPGAKVMVCGGACREVAPEAAWGVGH